MLQCSHHYPSTTTGYGGPDRTLHKKVRTEQCANPNIKKLFNHDMCHLYTNRSTISTFVDLTLRPHNLGFSFLLKPIFKAVKLETTSQRTKCVPPKQGSNKHSKNNFTGLVWHSKSLIKIINNMFHISIVLKVMLDVVEL